MNPVNKEMWDVSANGMSRTRSIVLLLPISLNDSSEANYKEGTLFLYSTGLPIQVFIINQNTRHPI